MDKVLIFILVLSSVLLPFLTHGQIQPIGPNSGWEELNPTVKVSGGFEVGIMDMSPKVLPQSNSFYVDLLEGDRSRLCVKFTSEDGQYSGRLSYDLADVEHGRTQFQWPTKFSDSFIERGIEKVAILSQVSESCDARIPGENMRLSSWNKSEFSDVVIIYINTSSRAWLSIDGDSGRKNYPCKKTKGDPSRAYTYTCACEMPKSVLTETSKVIINERSIYDADAEPNETIIDFGVR